MSQTTNQIEAQIEDTLEDLGANLDLLEQKVRSIADWRKYLPKNPLLVLGLVLCGSVLVIKALGGRRAHRFS